MRIAEEEAIMENLKLIPGFRAICEELQRFVRDELAGKITFELKYGHIKCVGVNVYTETRLPENLIAEKQILEYVLKKEKISPELHGLKACDFHSARYGHIFAELLLLNHKGAAITSDNIKKGLPKGIDFSDLKRTLRELKNADLYHTEKDLSFMVKTIIDFKKVRISLETAQNEK